MDVSSAQQDSVLVTKVGGVMLRRHAGVLEVLLVQPRPKPKTPEDMPPMGLARGTRRYLDPISGRYIDADHDGRTPPPEGALLEPVLATLAQELFEEAGVPPAMLGGQQVINMGVREFASRKKTPYPIHWFVVLLDDLAQAQLPHEGMQDSLFTQWNTLAEMETLVAQGKVSPGYMPVVVEAMGIVGIDELRN